MPKNMKNQNDNAPSSSKETFGKLTKKKEKPETMCKQIRITPKKTLIIIIGIIVLLILIIATLLIVYFYGFEKQSQTQQNEILNLNRIQASYKVKSGEELQFLNSKIIPSNEYKITLLSKKNSLRHLNSVLDAKSKFDFTGDITVAIDFNSSLFTTKSLFENITQLTQVNLTGLDMSKIIDMDSMFSGCSSLENIIFDGVDTRKVKSMNYLFKNCKNLKEVDMSPINTQNVNDMASLFSGCDNINSINISSFPKIKNDFLDGVNSNINVLSNERISNDLNKIALKSVSKKIKVKIIVVRDDDDDDSCEKGDKEKCKTCSNNIKGNCLLCNDGYYLPIDSNNKNKCTSCSLKEHCIKCIGQSSFIFCEECEKGYVLNNNNLCIKEGEQGSNQNEESCILGIEEKCVSCKNEVGKKNECQECNKGFYLPTDKSKNTQCESCKKIKNCASCSGTLNAPICDKCEVGFKLISNECKEILCERGMNEKCVHCNLEKDKKEECLSCNEGYFLPENAEDKTKCVKCSLEGCKTCSGDVNNEKCIACYNYPYMVNGEIKTCNKCKIGTGDNCLSCDDNNKCKTCNKGYKLVDGKCVLIDNTFYAVYNASTTNEPTKIMCNYHTNFKLSDFQMYVNNKLVIPSIIDIGNNPFIVYTFKYIGLHNVTVSFNKTLSSCIGWMFGTCNRLVSIKFSKSFDTKYVTSIYNMFVLDEILTSVDMSSFNTSNIYDMTDTFYSCKSLTSLDLSNFDTSRVNRMEGMFDYCANLNYIDLSSFNMTKVSNTKSMFSFVAKTGTIKISNLFGNYKNLIPKNWTIVN